MDGRAKRQEAALIAVLVLVAAFAVAQAWGRSLHPIIDAGRDLYVSEQLAGGAKLYRDIRYQYPPLLPYVLAAVTVPTGHSLFAYAMFGLAIGLLTAIVLYLSGRKLGDHLTAFAAAFLFLACSIANATTAGTTYLFPYSYAVTFGMLLFAAGVFALVEGAGRLAMGSAIVLLTLAGWTKIEYAAFGAAVVIVAALVRRISIGGLLVYAVMNGAIYAAAAWYFGDAPGGFRAHLTPAPLVEGEVAKRFYRAVVGLDDWKSAVLAVVMGFAALAAGVALLRWLDRRSGDDLRRAGATIAVAAVFGVGGAILWNAFFAAFLIVQLALVPFAIRERGGPLPILLIASLAASSRIFLRLMPVWYGFVYIVPVYILIAYLLLDWLPGKGVYSRRVAPLWLVTVAAIGIVTLAQQHEQHARKRYPIATARGVVLDEDPYRARILSAFLPMAQGRTLLVVPEGISLNYFARARNPLPFHTLTPPEIAYPGAEEAIVAALRKSPPDLVAIVTRPVGEFGFRGFGVDYGVQLMNAFRSMYDLDGRWTSPTFSLTLLRRKESGRAPTSSSRAARPESPRRSEGRSSAPAESR